MIRSKSLIFYLVLSLLCLRLVGMHVHLHNHAESGSPGASEVAHLSTTLEHGDLHEQDFDKDVLGASVVKKPGQGAAENAWSLLVAVFILALIVVHISLHLAQAGFDFVPSPRYLRPPVLAPPR